jgi:heavy metal sensor kinase
MKPLPIRLRLTGWYFTIFAVFLCLFGFYAYFAMGNSGYRTVDEELRERVDGVHALIQRVMVDEPEDLHNELREHSELQPGALLQVSDQQSNWVYRTRSMSVYGVPRSRANSGAPFTFLAGDARLRVLSAEVQVGNQTYNIQVASPLDELYGAQRRFETVLVISIPIFLLCAAAGGYWMSARALAPVDRITVTARTIGARNLSNRLEVPQTRDELQRLSETLNGMLDRLEQAFKRITQFTADASHELRTPISLMRTEAEITLSQPRSADEYRDAFANVYAELENTSDLVEKLLILARADSGAETLQNGHIDFAEILREVCHKGRVLAEHKSINFRDHIPGQPLWITGEANSLRRLLLILIDNAVRYTPSGGSVEVTGGLSADTRYALGIVRDTGIGIASEDLPHIFERFYRADKARSHESGGVGLGLSIGYWIAEAHGGTIEVESSLGKGSVFRVQLPIANNGHRH